MIAKLNRLELKQISGATGKCSCLFFGGILLRKPEKYNFTKEIECKKYCCTNIPHDISVWWEFNYNGVIYNQGWNHKNCPSEDDLAKEVFASKRRGSEDFARSILFS